MAGKRRHDFPLHVQRLLYKRVGTLCSNPACAAPTFGPNEKPNKFTSVGKAAHITAASPGGPRFDRALSHAERQSESNGVWLCSTCHDKADADEIAYPADLLREWKRQAEKRAEHALGTPRVANDFTTVLIVYRQIPGPWLDYRTAGIKRRKITAHPVQCPRTIQNVWMPVEFDGNWTFPESARRIDVFCQNLGTRPETNVRGHVDFGRSKIIANRDPTGYFREMNSVSLGSSFVSFEVATLMPGEYRCYAFVIDPVDTVTGTLGYDGCNPSHDVFVFDISYGPDEIVSPQSPVPKE
jgi:hypothetical protein